tara:strand:+ start:271 stop:1092 length:822 start_codon:yes stop_codon:yes gene_type:complete
MSVLIGTPYKYNSNYCADSEVYISENKKKNILKQLESTFKKLNIKVIKVDDNKIPIDEVCSVLWIRDIFVKINNTYILLPGSNDLKRNLIRKHEYKSVKPILKKYIINDNPESKIEGGDIIQHKNTIFIGLNKRTNMRGVNFLKSKFKNKHFVIIPHKSLHLDCCFCILHNNIIIYSKKSIGNLPLQVKSQYLCLDLETILGENINTDLALNFLIIRKDIITAFNNKFKPLYAFLELAGYNLHYIQFHNLQSNGGGVRCLTQWINTPLNQDFF